MQIWSGESVVVRACLIVLLVVVLPRPVRAADVQWQAPENCTASEFTTRIELLLGYSLSRVKDRDLRVAVAQGSATEWTLVFSWIDPAGEELGRRDLRGTSCADVTRAGAVAAAMALQADVAHRETQTGIASNQGAETPAPTLETSTQPTLVSTPTDTGPIQTPESDATRLWLVRLAPVGDSGTLGDPALGVGLDLGIHYAQVSAGLGGVGFPAVHREASPGQGGYFSLLAGQVWLCVRTAGKQWVPVACANYELGSLSGEGAGDRVNRSWSRNVLWQALRPELGIAVPLDSELEFDVRLGVSVALTRPDFVLDGELSILRPQRISPRAALGLRWAP